MEISKDFLKKQHQYYKQSSEMALFISVFFGLLISINNLGLSKRAISSIMGIGLLLFLWYNLKTGYYGNLYESRFGYTNRRDKREKVLLEIKDNDIDSNHKRLKLFFKSYFGFGIQDWGTTLLLHFLMLVLGIYLIYVTFKIN